MIKKKKQKKPIKLIYGAMMSQSPPKQRAQQETLSISTWASGIAVLREGKLRGTFLLSSGIQGSCLGNVGTGLRKR